MIKVGTLLFDEKQQYPGIVLKDDGTMKKVRWYKWGYKGPDFMDVYEHGATLIDQVVTEDHPFFRRHGLPPEYVKVDRRAEIVARLTELAAELEFDNRPGNLIDYVMGLLDNE